MFLDLLYPVPDPEVRGTDPDPDPAPDPSLIKQKKKCDFFMTFYLLKNDVNVA